MFENEDARKVHTVYSKSRNQILQCYDWQKKHFDQTVQRDMRTYGNTWKIATGQQDGYAAFAGLYLFLQISTIKW